jgi:outer membrane cobalamin receptor
MNRIIYVLIVALLPFSVFAADEDEVQGGIEEVIVTAERRAASIQDTAISITAFDSNLI